MTNALKAGDLLIPLDRVRLVDAENIERGEVVIHCHDGGAYIATGFDAIEAVMWMKPSALEGRRLKWRPHAWAFHNVVAHPVVQILAWLGLKRQAVRFHDWTTPRPRSFQPAPKLDSPKSVKR